MRLARILLVAIALLALTFASTPARAAFDPTLRFYTIETPHFRITYHSGLEEVGQHVADIAESIYGRMTLALGYAPKHEKTEIILIDTSESANGSASALPYNAVHLLVTAPEDFSPLGDVDDWYIELVSHEFTHVLHTDNISGIPALVNVILGKTLAPNQIQPRWILEGYGVFEESARTSAGRLRNSMWDMFMRSDVLEDNVAGLDQMSNVVRRWPQGNLFYLYGSYFVAWIADTYGEEALRKMAADYGDNIIPWAIQRTVRRATGKTYDELYPMWVASMKKHYGDQAAEVRRRGVREGKRLTHHGQIARYPRWIPSGAIPGHEGGLVYYRDDEHDRIGLYTLDVKRDASGAVTWSDAPHSDLIARTATESFSTFAPDGALYFGSAEYHRNVFLYNTIERVDAGKRSRYGTPDGGRRVLTDAAQRATDPAISPDGRHVVFCENHAGTRSIHIAEIADDHFENIRPLVVTSSLEQSFSPRWSPDGSHVVYTVWKHGGYRDIRYVDVHDGSFVDLTNDRAVEGSPSFSPDGRFVYFHSDRTGIPNVYAYELATQKLKQVTNVVTGAYSPDASPDGKTIAYVGYDKNGFDIYAMPVDETTWPDADPYVDPHGPTPAIVHRRWKSEPYSPWRTLMPRKYSVQITPGSFGEAIIVSADGSDLTGIHSVSASVEADVDKPEVEGSIAYTYGALPVDLTVSLFRSITPRGGYALGAYKPTVVQETAGFSSTIVYAEPTPYDGRSYVFSHVVSRVGTDLPVPIDKIDPYETPAFPVRGLTSSLHFAYNFSNSERYLWSVGPERGIDYSFSFDYTDPVLGSDFSGFVASADFTTYFLMPWAQHHSLALHAGGGTSGGNFPGRGAFFIGGFVDLNLVDTIRDQLIQGGFVLRGYNPVAVAGRTYTLGNAEYRFPIVNLDRGDSTLPIFVNRITGAAFVDYGSAFDNFPDAQFKTGVGAELWFDATLGYLAAFTFRLGFARGLSSLGINKPYFVAAVPF